MCATAFIKQPPRKPPPPPKSNAGIKRIQTREVRERERRSVAFATEIEHWLARYARHQEKKIRALLRRRGMKAGLQFKKATTMDELEDELRRLYMRFGLQQVKDAGQRWGASLGSDFVVTPDVKRRYAEEVENKVVLLISDTEQMVRRSLQTIIVDALSEHPRPTVDEVARRIHRQWHGPPTDDPIGRGTEAERRATADWRRRGEREALFSPGRARAIARTELGDADTAGAMEGFIAVGVEKAGWLARPNDGKSGDRQHYKMNDHPAIPVEDLAKSDRSKWFKLPSGARGRRPLDPLLPVGERVYCRCVLVPRR